MAHQALRCDNHGVRKAALIGVITVAFSAAWIAQPVSVSPQSRPGWALYDRYCLACHGEAGDGRGPAAPFTARRPRDFTRGEFAWRTTPLGSAPTRDDLKLTIRHGAPGTSMPAFALGDAEIDQLVDLVLAFGPVSSSGAPVVLAAPAKRDPERGKLLWTEKGCGTCHGPMGTGDSVVAKTMAEKPYDLTTEPLHRPRTGDLRAAVALAIATGRGPMPGYAGAMPDADLWALADHVVQLQASTRQRGAVMSTQAIDLDRTAKISVGTWPAAGDEAVIFGKPVPPQGTPTTLTPVEASLAAPQCARCHAKQDREWQGSRHRGAMSPGVRAQMMGMKQEDALACLRCHAPLSEQRTLTSTPLREQAVSCAGCHVRGFTRHGPPNVAPSLLPIPGYPLQTMNLYERADFCLPCHQLPPRTAVQGRPLLDTYREWLEGPYMARGIQCQHCHMPNREHEWKGVHDPHTFRQGIAVTARAHVKDGAVTVVAELANVGAGHYLPTTPTPAAWIVIELLDARGKAIEGATAELRIGRDISYDGGKWTERADTRIPPGDKATLARAWKGGRSADAVTARILVEVHPDDYYERLYARRLTQKLAPDRRALYEQALAAGKANRYQALTRDVKITR